MKKFSLIFAALFAFMTLSLFSQEYEFEALNLEVKFPEGWTHEVDGDILLASVENGEIAIAFTHVSGENLEAAMTAVMTEINKQYTNLELGEVKQLEMNGLTVTYLEGKGTKLVENSKGIEMEISLALIPGEGDEYLCILAYGTPSEMEKRAEEIQSVLTSIKPIKK